MVFYLKKAINLGPLRINFSKSGVGLSFGVKGLRIGSGTNGNYIHAGRKGVYYRKKLPDFDDNSSMLGWFGVLIVVALIGVAVWAVLSGIITINL